MNPIAYPPGLPVPVDNDGGAGTAGSHWRESVFGRELMTGYLSGGSQPMSRTTVESLADLGYGVDPEASDAYDLSAALRLAPAPVHAGDEQIFGPLYEVDESGVVTPIVPR